MATIYLTNLQADVSGYKLALVDERNPNPPSSVATAVTNTTSSGSNIQMTLTAGGTTAKWITKPLKEAVTINSTPYFNIWAKESAAAANAGLQVRFAQYTTSEGSGLLTSSFGTELDTTVGNNQWVSSSGISSTAFAVGDRLVVLPYINNVGTMGASETVTMDFDGGTADADGDTYILIQEALRMNEAQVGNGSVPTILGVGVSYFFDLAHAVQDAINRELIASNATAQSIIDEANNQKELV